MDRERLAAEMHTIWSDWMKYMFARCFPLHNGDHVILAYFVGRWQRQMNTDYEQLSEHEKESDRELADKIAAIIEEE